MKLPHPHLPDITEIAAHVLEETRRHLRRPKPVYPDPDAVARWSEWLTPDEWDDEHTGRTEER